MRAPRERHTAVRSLRWAMLGLVFPLAACTAKTATNGPENQSFDAVLTNIAPELDTTGADCTGRLHRDTAHTVSGRSTCRNGAGVVFSGQTDASLDASLLCDYALFYVDRTRGSGRIVCNDGATGSFSFEETEATHGVATVMMKDGREIKLTYTQTVN